jgi:MerR family transcriptional regulator, thiopeptide resistance regulator
METYLVQEFARMAGVTVRTLHYYDETGLLKPTRRAGARYRVYQRGDLLRLQQILTLKAMGFALDEIRDLLESDGYDIQESLRIQKDAIDRRITQLQQASAALEKTLEMLGQARDLDWAHVSTIIQIVSRDDKHEWARRYFSEAALRKIQVREIPVEEIRQGERDWMRLAEQFKAVQHLPPDHPDVQALMPEYARLIEGFTQGDPEIEASLRRMYNDFENIPSEFRIYDAALARFMREACQIYYQRRDNP